MIGTDYAGYSCCSPVIVPAEFCGDHQHRNDGGCKIGDRSRIHQSVDAEQERKQEQKRQQEKDLSCQGQKHTPLRLADRCEEIRGDRLQKVQEGEEQVNMEIIDRKTEIIFASFSEDRNDLTRSELE